MKYIGDQNHRQVITHYSPDSSLKPIVLFSLLVDIKKDTSEIAVAFVSALNFHHALEICYVQSTCLERAGWDNTRKDKSQYQEFKLIGKYNSIEKGLKELHNLSFNMTWEKYLIFLDKHFRGDKK